MSTAVASPVAEIFASLRALDASWGVEIARPSGQGWVAGADLRDATAGPFNELLERIGERAKTTDRKTIAASFALRYGWASAMAIAPYLRFRCVPDIALDNVSFKCRGIDVLRAHGDVRSTRHRRRRRSPCRTSIDGDRPRRSGAVAGAPRRPRIASDARRRRALCLVGTARRGTWGMLTSSWASQFTNLSENRDDQRSLMPVLDGLFAGNDVISEMAPAMRPVAYGGAVHLYQRRASCCRYYLLPAGDLCASCPLVSDEERLVKNVDWMKTQLERQVQRARPRLIVVGGHRIRGIDGHHGRKTSSGHGLDGRPHGKTRIVQIRGRDSSNT